MQAADAEADNEEIQDDNDDVADDEEAAAADAELEHETDEDDWGINYCYLLELTSVTWSCPLKVHSVFYPLSASVIINTLSLCMWH